jgi:hypothetical protein
MSVVACVTCDSAEAACSRLSKVGPRKTSCPGSVAISESSGIRESAPPPIFSRTSRVEAVEYHITTATLTRQITTETVAAAAAGDDKRGSRHVSNVRVFILSYIYTVLIIIYN